MSTRSLLRWTLVLVSASLLFVMLAAITVSDASTPSSHVAFGSVPSSPSASLAGATTGPTAKASAAAALDARPYPVDTGNGQLTRRPMPDTGARVGAIHPSVAAAWPDGPSRVPVIVLLRSAAREAAGDSDTASRGPVAVDPADGPAVGGDGSIEATVSRGRMQATLQAKKRFFDARLDAISPSLAHLHAAGHAGPTTSLWLASAVAVEVDAVGLRVIADMPSVRLVILDERVVQDPWAPIGASDTPGGRGSGDEPLWNVTMVHADSVWERLGIDGQGVTIGVLDSGVDYHHDALTTRYRGYVGGPSPSNAGNWWCKSTDFLCGQNPLYPVDGVGHGTHVAGSAVAPHGVGVAPGANWIAARVCSRADACWLSWILEALQWMVEGDPATRADVVNVSLALLDNPAMKDAFATLTEGGIAVVAASGNDKTVVRAPAIYPNVIAVGAVTQSGEMWPLSSHGKTTEGLIRPDLVAPGEFVTSTVPGGGWARASGTSMASPHVAGAVALLLHAEPDLTPAEVQSILRDTAVPLSSTKPHPVSGWGLLNAYGAVLSVTDAGRVEGRVFDTTDRSPIPWAEVVVTTTSGEHVTMAAVSDEGAYTLDLAPGDYLLLFRAFTYQGTTRAANVRQDSATTIDVGLEIVADVGFYVGTVSDASTGVGLDGVIQIEDVPDRFAISVDRYAGFSQRMPPGEYEIRIAEYGYRVLTDTVTIAPGSTVEHNYKLVPTPKILLVDGDAWAYSAAMEYYQDSLRRLGYVHHGWRVTDEEAPPGEAGGPPSDSDLAAYDLVIWSSSITGPTFVGGASPIATYLSSGGRLIMSGQDALCTDASSANATDPCNQKARPHPYVRDQLHLRVLSGNARAFDVAGSEDGPLAGLDVRLNGPQSMDNQMTPDVIESVSPLHARIIGVYPDGRGAGALVDTCEPHRAALLGFGFEGVSGAVTRDSLLQRLIDAVTAESPEWGLSALADPGERIVPAGETAQFTVTLHSTGRNPTSLAVEVVSSEWEASLWSSGFEAPLQLPIELEQCQAVRIGVRVLVPPTVQRGAVVSTTLVVSDPAAGLYEELSLVTRATAPVLLVDGDFGSDTEDRYEQALQHAGVPFDSWELGLMATEPVLPTDADLAKYPMVVWFTGDDWRPNGTLDLETQAMLSRYLDAGGRLYFTSEDYLSIRGGSPFDGERFFHEAYLGTHDYHPDAGAAHGSPLTGVADSVLGDLTECRLQWKPPEEDFSDRLVPSSTRSRAALVNSVGLPVAVESASGAFRSLFLAFDAGELDQTCADDVMARAIDWFSPMHLSRLTLVPEGRLTYASGDTLHLRLDVLNGGLADVTGVSVRWLMPEGGSLVEASIPVGWAWDASARALTWHGDLAVGAPLVPVPEVLFKLDDDLPEYTMHASTATILADSVPVVRRVTWRVNAPDLRQSTKSVPDDQRDLEVGQATTFAINVRNTGTRSADTFVVTDTLPAGLVLLRETVSTDGGSLDLDTIPNGLVWRGSVGPGSTRALSYEARVDTYLGGWLRNQASLDDMHGTTTQLAASVFVRPKLLLPWLGREVDPDP